VNPVKETFTFNIFLDEVKLAMLVELVGIVLGKVGVAIDLDVSVEILGHVLLRLFASDLGSYELVNIELIGLVVLDYVY